MYLTLRLLMQVLVAVTKQSWSFGKFMKGRNAMCWERLWIMTGPGNWTLRSHDYCPVKLPFWEGAGGVHWTPAGRKYFGWKHCTVIDAQESLPFYRGWTYTCFFRPFSKTWLRTWGGKPPCIGITLYGNENYTWNMAGSPLHLFSISFTLLGVNSLWLGLRV